jgi:hypothetical protein
MIIAGYVLGALALLTATGLAAWSRAHPEQHNRFVHDAPVMIMYGLGAWLFLPTGWVWSVAYLAVVTGCSLWFIVRVCPHCVYHGREDGPSVYCAVATRLTSRGELRLFTSRFRQSLVVTAVGWLAPIVGGVMTLQQPDRLAYGVVLLAVFGLVAFYLVPTAAKPSCERCLNKETCPRGGRTKDTVKETPPPHCGSSAST